MLSSTFAIPVDPLFPQVTVTQPVVTYTIHEPGNHWPEDFLYPNSLIDICAMALTHIGTAPRRGRGPFGHPRSGIHHLGDADSPVRSPSMAVRLSTKVNGLGHRFGEQGFQTKPLTFWFLPG